MNTNVLNLISVLPRSECLYNDEVTSLNTDNVNLYQFSTLGHLKTTPSPSIISFHTLSYNKVMCSSAIISVSSLT